jgi:hypothetical protein
MRFEALKAVTIKDAVFWDVTPYSLVGHQHCSETLGTIH